MFVTRMAAHLASHKVRDGTCNYVLDRMSEGITFEKAVVEAQSCGFAEADVARDLNGADSEGKLRIPARRAFGDQYENWPIWHEGLQLAFPEAGLTYIGWFLPDEVAFA